MREEKGKSRPDLYFLVSLFFFYSDLQVWPASEVEKRRPSAVVIVAAVVSAAKTATRSDGVGELIFCQCSPSVVRRIVPPAPTIQHVVGEGAAPARRADVTPLSCGCQEPSGARCSIAPPAPRRHRTILSAVL